MVKKPLLIASIPVESPQDLLKVRDVAGVDFTELRVDYLDDPSYIDYSVLPKNVVVTLRDVAEGGVKQHRDEIKLRLISSLNELDLIYDVEMNFVKKYNISYVGKIVSVHIIEPSKIDLKSVKKDVEVFMDKAFIVKVATKPFPRYKTFLIDLLELGDNIAVMAIDTDYVERVAFTLLGSKLLYCYIDKPTALGQPKCDEAKQILTALMKN